MIIEYQFNDSCSDNYLAFLLTLIAEEYITIEQAFYIVGGEEYDYLQEDANNCKD